MTTNKKVIEHTLACVICGTENKMNEEVYQYTATEVERVFNFECSECGYKEAHTVQITLPTLKNDDEEITIH